MRVSTATRLWGSSLSIESRIASLIWSAILSGWPSVTDSEVKSRRDTVWDSLQRLLADSCRAVRDRRLRGAPRVPDRPGWFYWSTVVGAGAHRGCGGGGFRSAVRAPRSDAPDPRRGAGPVFPPSISGG